MVDVGYSRTFFLTYEKKNRIVSPRQPNSLHILLIFFLVSIRMKFCLCYLKSDTFPHPTLFAKGIFLRLSNIICLHSRTKYFENNLQTVFAWALPIKTGFSLQRDYSKWIILSKLKTPYTYSTFSKSIKKDARRSLSATSCFSISCTNILLYILSYRDSKR